MADVYERVLGVTRKVLVYGLPPRTSNRGYRAADWGLDNPSWTGRMRLISLGPKLEIKLEDPNSGELFARCPVDAFPGQAVESVQDSSRYFVLRIQSDNGQIAFIGLGFEDRSDSFDFNLWIQDHFKSLRKEEAIAKEEYKPALDLGFKEGQTIKINLQSTKKPGASARPKPKSGGGGILLPPPPGGAGRILPPPPPGASAAAATAPPAASVPAPAFTGFGDDVGNKDWVQFE